MELYETTVKANENVPNTSDVGDPGTVFAPNFAVQKRPRIEAIHGPEKRLAHQSKKI